jgi:flagellar biosynthesis/type III secretory pathway chaperone
VNAQVEELVRVLERETELVRELVDVLQADQQRIVRQDVAGLEQSNAHKEALVVRLQGAELQRRTRTAELGAALGLSREELRVSHLCPRLGAGGQKLAEAAERLRALLGGLAELVAVSRGFLEQSILGIRGLLSLLESLRTSQGSTYDASGFVAPPRERPALALRREV